MSKPTYDPITKIWHGPKVPPFFNPDQNVGYIILHTLQQTPDLVTQISADTGVSVTCQQMYERSIRIAKYLRKSGMKEGDCIGFVTANTENLAPVIFACFTLGLLTSHTIGVNPLSLILDEKDIIRTFSMTKPKMIFCDAENVKDVQNAVDEMKSEAKILTVMDKVDGYECVTAILKEMEGVRVDDFQYPIIDPNSTAAILCSSGTTGFTKGICKSHKQILTDFSIFTSQGGTPICFQTSPIFWLSSFRVLIVGTFSKCIRVVTAKPFTALDFVNIVNEYKVTVVMVAPSFLVSLLQIENLKPLESIKFLMIGGSTASDQICEKFKPFIPNGIYITGYGCTEDDGLAANFTQRKLNSAGFVSTNVQLRIVDSDGNNLGPNESGEIYSKIPKHFSGYIGYPEKTIEAFDGDWFKTGDIGYFDDEQFLYITGRAKELLMFNGIPVTPSEIEAIISEIEGIASSCVVGVRDLNTGNDIMHAFVVLEVSNSLSEEFILKYVNDKVIDPKRIRGGVHIVDSFPLGYTGKVDRRKIKEMAQNLAK